MNVLPHCDDLFQKFFDPWYNDAGRKRRQFKATFPDMMQNPSLIGMSQAQVSRVNDEMQQTVLEHIAKMVEAARHDLNDCMSYRGDIDLHWVDTFDRFATRKNIHNLISKSDPNKYGNDYIVIVCEFGAALSHALRAEQPRPVWLLDWPYWDSCLFDPKTGTVIPIFHWAMKRMSEYGLEEGYALKARACLRLLQEERKL